MIGERLELLDADQLEAYLEMQKLFCDATRCRLDACDRADRALDAFARALSSDASKADRNPWKIFIVDVVALIAVLEAASIPISQRACLAKLKQIVDENRDLVV